MDRIISARAGSRRPRKGSRLVSSVKPHHRIETRAKARRRAVVDPTRTKTIRARYEAATVRRFRAFQRDLFQSVGPNDAFAITLLDEARVRREAFTAALRAQFFNVDPTVALRRFNKWLAEQIDLGILEVLDRDGQTVTRRREWQNEFIQSARKRAIVQAHAKALKVGVLSGGATSVEAVLSAPIHARTAKLIFERNFSVLQGITADMERRIQRVVAQGLADGTGAIPMARRLRDEVGISIKRARVMARTETINAHATTTLDELGRQGFAEVEADVEFSSTGDGRVCQVCQGLTGQVFTLKRARGIIPVHPNCRCSWLPANIGENRAEARRAAARKRREITRLRKEIQAQNSKALIQKAFGGIT